MPLILKTKPKEVVQTPQIVEEDIVAPIYPEVDELVQLLDWAAKQKKDKRYARLADLKKKFDTAANKDDLDPDARVIFLGVKSLLDYGPKSNDRYIKDKDKLLEFLEPDVIFSIANFNLGDLDKLLTGVQKKGVLDTVRGSRSQSIKTRPVPEEG